MIHFTVYWSYLFVGSEKGVILYFSKINKTFSKSNKKKKQYLFSF